MPILQCLPTSTSLRVVLVIWLGLLSITPVVLFHYGGLDDYVPILSKRFLWYNTPSVPIVDETRNVEPNVDFDAPRPTLVITTEPFLQVVMHYPVVLDQLDKAIVRSQDGQSSRPASMAELQRRQQEYHEALRHTLVHPAVHQLHLLVRHVDDLRHLQRALHPAWSMDGDGLPVYKLQIHLLNRSVLYGDTLTYINTNLVGQYVAIMAADVFLTTRGWFDLNAAHFGPENRTVYTLSRHGPLCPARPTTGHEATAPIPCEGLAQRGQIQGLVFRAPVPSSVMSEMRAVPVHLTGAENQLATALAHAQYAPLLNPCNVLQIWHNQCSRVFVRHPSEPTVLSSTEARAYRVGQFVTGLPDE